MKLLIQSIFLFLCMFEVGCNRTEVKVQEEETESQDDDSGEPVIWIGPGLYYGIWFDSETDFDDWNYRHPHHHDHENHRRDGHHEHDHSPHNGPRGGGHHQR